MVLRRDTPYPAVNKHGKRKHWWSICRYLQLGDVQLPCQILRVWRNPNCPRIGRINKAWTTGSWTQCGFSKNRAPKLPHLKYWKTMSWSYSQRCFGALSDPEIRSMTAVSMLNVGPQSSPWQFYFWWNTQGKSPQVATHLCIVCNVKQQTLQWHGEQTLSVHPKISQTVPRKVWWSLLGRVALGLKISQQNQSKLCFFHWFRLTKLTLIVFNFSFDVQEFLWFWWAFSDFLSGSIWMIQLTTSYLMRKSWCHGRLIHGRLVVQEAPKNKNKLEK